MMVVQHRWFLSYHSPDGALAERLKAAIERKDSACRVFFAPENLRAGGFWTVQLAQEIADATGFILLVGEKGIGSWQLPEYAEALDKRVKSPDFPVVLMLLAGQTAPGLPFLRQLHWIVTPDPASDKDIARLFDAASGSSARPGELWRYTAPYRGLVAMEEKDSDYFFGRERETVEALNVLAAAPDKIPLLLGNSGVGKSSVAQAGVLAALRRQAWPDTAEGAGGWPAVFDDSRRWCFIKLRPGIEPVASLVEPFLETWQLDRTSTEWPERRAEWVDDLLNGKLALRDLLDQTRRRYVELRHPEPAAFLIYIDQGEELYVRADQRHRRRFSELLAQGLCEPRLHALMSMRSDFYGELQRDEQLYQAHRLISVTPLREAQLLEVVSRPAALLSARFQTDRLAVTLARRTAEESTKDTGALPLLSYLLDDMWTRMVKRGDGVLRLPEEALELGGVLVERANAFISHHPGSEDKLRRIFTLKLATVREDGTPTRRRAWRSEFADEEWRLVTELADHPNRLLITAAPEVSATKFVPRSAGMEARAASTVGQTYAEVAHEAIFLRWDKLRDWIAAERGFLAWRTGLEAARRVWQSAPEELKTDALLLGLALAQAQSWLAKRPDDIPEADQEFVILSRETMRRREWRRRAAVRGLVFAVILALAGWYSESYVRDRWNWLKVVRPYMLANIRPAGLNADAERALKPGESFRECSAYCPEMIVVPAGVFMMGSPERDEGRSGEGWQREGPQHEVTIARPFAVSKFDVTFAEWDGCVWLGGCPLASDSGMGRGTKPVINVTPEDAQYYVKWLSGFTGQPYRLLTEAEWEYAARAGTTTAYYWGDEIGEGNANCNGCGSKWDSRETSPVGSFNPNAFGLYDMAGNVYQWTQDCDHSDYNGAPKDGSARTTGDCSYREGRGGSWDDPPNVLRTANRGGGPSNFRDIYTGFRVARTLTP